MDIENFSGENNTGKMPFGKGISEYGNSQFEKENRMKEILEKLGESYKFKVRGSSYYIEKKGEKEGEFLLTNSYKDFRFIEDDEEKENEKKVYGSKSGNFEDEKGDKEVVGFKKFDPSQIS